MRPHICSGEAHRIAFGFSPPDDLYFATRLRDGLGEGGGRPGGQGPSGSSAPGKQRIRSASGHATANARRMRLVVSTTQAAIFKRRRRSVANSAVANSLLWEWRRARSASTNKRRCGERGGLDWRAPNGN